MNLLNSPLVNPNVFSVIFGFSVASIFIYINFLYGRRNFRKKYKNILNRKHSESSSSSVIKTDIRVSKSKNHTFSEFTTLVIDFIKNNTIYTLCVLFIFCILYFIFNKTMISIFNKVNIYIIIMILLFLCLIPSVVRGWHNKKRLRMLQNGLPDALDVLVICAEAGLSLDASLKRVADEFATTFPELAEELLQTSIELNFLHERRQALMNLVERVDLPSFRGVVTTLVQAEKYGTPLAQAFRTLSFEIREKRLLDAEEKAARLPAILTVPLIVFILPALFIVVAAPAFIEIYNKL